MSSRTKDVVRRSVRVRWIVANLVSSSIGFGVFAVIAHGIASPHDEEHPSLAQFTAHAVGLLPAGAIIALGQKLALGRYRKLAPWFVPATSLAMTAAFLIGAYGLSPPFDFLFSYAVIGAAIELALKLGSGGNLRETAQRTAVTASLFTAGSFVGMLALSLFAKALGIRLGAPGEDVVRHLITMALGGLFIGAATGLLTAHRIAKRVIRRLPSNMALQRTHRPRLRSGRSLRSLGSPLNARPLGRKTTNQHSEVES